MAGHTATELDARTLILLATYAEGRIADVGPLLDEYGPQELGYIIGYLVKFVIDNLVQPQWDGAEDMRMQLAAVLRGAVIKAMADGVVE